MLPEPPQPPYTFFGHDWHWYWGKWYELPEQITLWNMYHPEQQINSVPIPDTIWVTILGFMLVAVIHKWKDAGKAWEEAEEAWRRVPDGIFEGIVIGGFIGSILGVILIVYMYLSRWHP